jgi:hypothetical protein
VFSIGRFFEHLWPQIVPKFPISGKKPKKYLGEKFHRHIKRAEFYSDFESVELVEESHIKND